MRNYDHTEVTVNKRTIFLDTLSTSKFLAAKSWSVNKIQQGNGQKKKTKLVFGSVAAVTDGKCTRCSSSGKPHIDKIKKGEKCDATQCTHCSKFYHTAEEFSNPNSSQFKGNPVNQISEATVPAGAARGEIN